MLEKRFNCMPRVLYVTRNDGTDTRMSKECMSLLDSDYDVIFLGWDRSPDGQKPDPIPNIEKYIYVKPAGFRSFSLFFAVWRYYFFFFRTVLKLRPDIVHVVNEDLALMVSPFKLFFRFKVVLDIYDSFSLRYASSNLILKYSARVICKFCWWLSDVILVTDADRLNRLNLEHNKTWIVSNFPVEPDDLSPKALQKTDERLYIYVAGTLYSARGLEQILNVIESQSNVYVICAGWLYDECAEQFVKHEKVNYVGVTTPAESLQYAAACDMIFAFYDPVNDNMLLASPNKIYDAMCVGRPVIINSETQVSKWVEEVEVGYACPYNDILGLTDIVDSMLEMKLQGIDNSALIRKIFEQGYSWKTAEKQLVEAYASLR